MASRRQRWRTRRRGAWNLALRISEVSRRYYGVSSQLLRQYDGINYQLRTCFWAGDTFTPKLKVKTRNGHLVSVQQYLQGAYLDMFDVVASKLGDLDGVLGFQVSGNDVYLI
jgi:hypothetical protein